MTRITSLRTLFLSLLLLALLSVGSLAAETAVPLSSLPDRAGLEDFLQCLDFYRGEGGTTEREYTFQEPALGDRSIFSNIVTNQIWCVDFSRYPGPKPMAYCNWLESCDDYTSPYYGHDWKLNGKGIPFDPLQLFMNSQGYHNSEGYFVFDRGNIRWILQNIFHCSPQDIDIMERNNAPTNPTSSYADCYTHGNYYYVAIGGLGWMGQEMKVVSAATDGTYYYITYSATWDDSYGGYYPGGTRTTIYYATMGYETIDGKSYWTMYANSEYGFVHFDNLPPFSDVLKSDWFAQDVSFVVENGLMNGVDGTHFSPNTPATRAQIAAILHRLAGSPKGSGNPFFDVKKGDWYTEAVAWANGAGIVQGTGGGNFSPNAPVTREQLAVMLYRFCTVSGLDTQRKGSLSAFSDKGAVSGYAQEALSWAVGTGLLSGTSPTTLSPQGQATRSQAAAILHRMVEGLL